MRTSGEADEVHEKHRHDLALLDLRGWSDLEFGPALGAELGLVGVLVPAIGTDGHKTRAPQPEPPSVLGQVSHTRQTAPPWLCQAVGV